MPEETDVATTPTAAEIYAEMTSSEEEQAGNPPPDNEEEEERPDSESDDVPAGEDGAEEEEEGGDEEELSLSDRMRLDDSIRQKEPELAKRWDEQIKGLEKIDRRLKADQDNLDTWVTIDKALSSKETAPGAAQALLKIVLANTGLSVQELLGLESGEEVKTGVSKYGLEYDSDDRAVDLAIERAVAKVREDLGVDPDLLRALKAEQEQKERTNAENAWFDSKGKGVIARAEKLAGWKVQRDLVLEARRQFPDLFRSDPVLAMKKTDPDAYADRKRPEVKKVPDMMKGNTARGIVSPTNPEEYTALDAARELGYID